jgi:integrase
MDCRKCKREIPDDAIYCPYCSIAQAPKKGRKLRGNGTGSAYKRGKTWTAVYIAGWKMAKGKGDKEHLVPVPLTKGGFKTKKEALDYIPTLRDSQKKPDATTLAALFKSWSENELLTKSSSKQTAYEIAYGKIKTIAHRNIADLTIDDLRSVVKENAKTYYPARDIKTLLSQLYKMAVAQQYITVNLAEFIVLPKLEEAEQTPFNEEELVSLWEDYGSGNTFTGYILLMIYSGMMPGELLNAKKDMVDWDNQVIVGAGLKTEERKTKPLVVADLIVPVLAELCEYSKSRTGKLVCMNKDNFYKTFYATLERCGCRPLPPYSCRHTTATALALGDVAPSVIQKVMRHARFTTTERYIHVDTGPMLAAINKILEKRKEKASE